MKIPVRVRPKQQSVKPEQKQTNWRDKAAKTDLKNWYSSEDAKRSFGNICRAVSVQQKNIHLMGSEKKPLVTLMPFSEHNPSQFDINITIDEAKADWSSVMMAVMLFGTTFIVSGTYHTHAIMQRHDLNRHGALRYRRPQLEDIPQNFSILLDDLREVSDTFLNTTKLIDRRFKEVWRDKNL